MQFTRCTTEELAAALDDDECQVIDVREPGEFRGEYIPGTRLTPLSELEKHHDTIDADRPLLVLCRSGNRASQAAERLAAIGCRDVRVVDGGLLAWSQEGRHVERTGKGVWAMDRQIRFAAGSLVVAGLAGAVLIHPAVAALSAAVGAGLVFSAVTDTCAMGSMLARMPWNRAGGAMPDAGCQVSTE